VAFHHAGLDLQKRKLVEDAYKEGKIKILLSTTTLIAGVNLPATLVIFDSLSFWDGNRKQVMSKRDFLNGCGRAGRPGLETRGRALIMANSLLSAIQFIARPLEKVESQFSIDTLVFQTLAIIKRNADLGQKYTSMNDLDNFFRHSFYFSNGFKIDINNYLNQLLIMEMISAYEESQKDNIDVKSTIQHSINRTNKNNVKEHINQDNFHHYSDKGDIKYIITKLGYETIRFYLNPRTGFLIRNMLFALDSHLSNKNFDLPAYFFKINKPNKISLVSIIHTLIHAKEFQTLWKTSKLKEDEKEFAKDHIEELILNRSMYISENLEEDERKCLSTTMAFYEKLNMQDISQKSRFESLYQRFGRGDFASLQENMEWLVGASLKIAKVIITDNKSYEVISKMLSILSRRISSGMVKEDLLELCNIKEIGRIRSFTLANAGINSIEKLVNPYNKRTIDNILGSEQLTKRIIENAKNFQKTTITKSNKIKFIQ
jgi:replicative superfamily II helicase